MQVISSFLLILLENPPCPLNPLLSFDPLHSPSACIFSPIYSHLACFLSPLTHTQLAPFFKNRNTKPKKRSKPSHPLPPFYPPFFPSLLTLLSFDPLHSPLDSSVATDELESKKSHSPQLASFPISLTSNLLLFRKSQHKKQKKGASHLMTCSLFLAFTLYTPSLYHIQLNVKC